MGSGTRRVLLYGHDSYGLGHLRRNLRIARSLRDQLGDAGQVFVLSGSPVLSRAHPPHGVTIIPLPPVVKTGPDLYASRVPGMSYESVIEKRAAIILKTLKELRPDLFVVDHSPLGVGNELEEALNYLADVPTVPVLGLRDIIDIPERVIPVWREKNMYRVLERYEEIWVYGDQKVFDPGEAYAIPVPVRSRIRFMGYLGYRDPDFAAECPATDPFLIVSAGGGEDGEPLFDVFFQIWPRLRRLGLNAVRASVTYPASGWRFWSKLAESHLAVATRRPLRYLWALTACLEHFYRPASWKNFFRAAMVARWAWKHRIDYLHAHFAHGPASVAYFAHLMTGLPFSISGHAKDLYLTPPQALQRRLKRARFMVTCTAANASYLKKLAPKYQHKVHVVRHGVDLAEFQGNRQGAPTPETVPIFLSVGRLVEKKGYPDLLAAYRLLQERGIPFRARIVGTGPLFLILRQQVTTLGLEDVVEFLGALSHEELIPFYHDATLFVLAPHILESGDRDGLPNVILEAMASRLPIVVTRTSGIPEVLVDRQHAILAEPRSPEDLADALEFAVNNPQVMAQLADAAYHMARARFDFRETTQSFSDLLAGRENVEVPVWGEQGVVP